MAKGFQRWGVLMTMVTLLTACATSHVSETSEQPSTRTSADEETRVHRHGHETHHGDGHQGDGHHGHAGHHDHRFTDPEHYAKRWNDPSRDAWQQPRQVVDAMAIEPGMIVADIGAGTGYFVPHLSDAVGAEGRVLAVDIEQVMLDYINQSAEREGWTNVETLLAGEDTSSLGAASVDRIITVNTWHHIPNRSQYAAHLAQTLKPGGSIWVVDYALDAPQGPPAQHRLAPEVIIGELEAGGLHAELHPLELERQFIVVATLKKDE